MHSMVHGSNVMKPLKFSKDHLPWKRTAFKNKQYLKNLIDSASDRIHQNFMKAAVCTFTIGSLS